MGQKQRKSLHIELPKHNEFVYYFGIYFPERKQSISGNIRIIYIFSGLLLLVTLFFGYALIVILKQRRFSEIQNDVVNNLTHEFKTPLSSILLSTEVLSNKEILFEPERIKSYSRIIRTQAQYILSQVDRVLGMGELENINKLILSKIDIHTFLSTLSSELQEKVKTKSGCFEFDPKATQSLVCADKFHLANLIYNLVDNSVKYSEKPPAIVISTISDQKYLFLHVKDNGIGIDKKYKTKIFKKFFRIPTGNIHNVKGFGLGLHYVYNIVEKHRWRITFKSKINEGTTFIIRMPLKHNNCE